MEIYSNLAIITVFTFLYSITSGGFDRTPFNGAIIFSLFGLAAGPLGLDILHFSIEGEGVRMLPEITLALVLFSDAANADLDILKKNFRIPQRLLLLGLPLTIALGALFGRLLFPELGLFEIAVLATILAPTDAALGAAVVSDQRVPAPVREGLNFESGLNDGICVPVLLTFLAVSAGSVGSDEPITLALRLVFEQIGIGLLVGTGVAFVGSYLFNLCVRMHLINGIWLQLPVIALSLSCFALAPLCGGSSFIGAFCGGLLFGGLTKNHKKVYLAASEVAGGALSLLTWVIFGAAVISLTISAFSWQNVLYALLSLTVVRMLPVFISLKNTGLPNMEKLFIGWFGPRGLATGVFAIIVASSDLPHRDTIVMTAICGIALSIIFHGVSANPLIALLVKKREKAGLK